MDGELKELHGVKNQLECRDSVFSTREYGARALAVGIANQFNSYASTYYYIPIP